MHDPLVVAWTIPRPWPSRSRAAALGRGDDGPRWRIRLHHQCTDYCRDNDPPHRAGAFPWWRPGSYSKFWRLAGRDLYWPPMITVWHREPGGHDALTICRHRYQDKNGQWHLSRGWRWHIWHYHLQVHPAQAARRRLLTRCAWCGGRSRKGDEVNHSHSWDGPRGRWWQGEPGLYHRDCSAAEIAHRTCTCPAPSPAHGDWGPCMSCGRFVAWGRTAEQVARARWYQAYGAGVRPPADPGPALLLPSRPGRDGQGIPPGPADGSPAANT